MDKAHHSVLFVCTANQYRSPLAMALLRYKVEKEGWEGTWRIESAGTWAQEGVPVLEWVAKGLAGRGISLDDHESREVTRALLADFQLILAMDGGHKEALQVEFTESAGRVFLLSEMAGTIEEVADVGRRGYRAFKDVAEQIEQMLELGKDRLIQLSMEPASAMSRTEETHDPGNAGSNC